MKKLLLILLTCLFMTGCAEYFAGRAAFEKEAVIVDDEEAYLHEEAFCKLTKIGAWVRKYGGDPQKAEGWRQACGAVIGETPNGSVKSSSEENSVSVKIVPQFKVISQPE